MVRKVMILAACCTIFFANCFAQNHTIPVIDLQYPESLNIFLFHQQDSIDLSTAVNSHREFKKIIQHLSKKQAQMRTEEEFLRELFYYVHSKKLKSYNKYAVMRETLENGTYGCLTGTALYANLLSAFNYGYEIVKLPKHVFIQVNTKKGYYIVESTLPREGFRKLDSSILPCLEPNEQNIRKSLSLEVVGNWYGATEVTDQPFELIGLKELAGLQHFNEAVNLYSQNNFEDAIDRATEAYKLYPTKRNHELMQLIVNKILRHDVLTGELRSQILNQYVSMVKTKKLSQTK